MSHSYNNFTGNNPPGNIENQFGGLESLIFPTPSPIQQNHQHTWPTGPPHAPSWQNNIRQNNYGFQNPCDGQMNSAGYFPNQQDFSQYDDGEDFYADGNDNASANQHPPQPQLRKDDYDAAVDDRAAMTTRVHERPQSAAASAKVTLNKASVVTTENRAAELRARLLASRQRDSTPTAKTKPVTKDVTPKPTDAMLEAIPKPSDGTKALESVVGMRATSTPHISPDEFLAGIDVPANAIIPDATTKITDSKKEAKVDIATSRSEPLPDTNGRRASLVESEASSETSELGEIRSDHGKSAPTGRKEGPTAQDTKEAQVNGDNSIGNIQKSGTIVTASKEQRPPEASRDESNGVHKAQGGAFAQPLSTDQTKRDLARSSDTSKPKLNTKLPSGPSRPPDQFRTPRSDYAQDRYSRPSSPRGWRRDTERDRAREPYPHERFNDRIHDSYRPSMSRANLNDVDRRPVTDDRSPVDRPEPIRLAPRQPAGDIHRVQTVDRTRSEAQPAQLDRPNEHDQVLDDIKRRDEATMNQPVIDQTANGLTKPSQETANDKTLIELGLEAEEVLPWLELTGYYDDDNRKKFLTRHFKLKELEEHRAELEREARVEFEEMFVGNILGKRAKSIGPPSRSLGAHSSTIMPPPPPPIKESYDDPGIKIKDMAIRDNLLSLPRFEDNTHAGSQMQDPTHTTSSLKRQHANDTDTDMIDVQPAGKLQRIDTQGQSQSKTSQNTPLSMRPDPLSLESRISKDDHGRYRGPMGYAENRRRSMSPSSRRASGTEMRRQNSGGSYSYRNGYSPNRRPDASRDSSPILRDTGARDYYYDDNRENVHEYRNYDRDFNSPHPPFENHRYVANNYRGRGRGRAGYNNNRGGYKGNKTVGGTQNGEQSGSKTLDLDKGGQSRP